MSSASGWKRTDGQRLGPLLAALCGPFTVLLHFAARHPSRLTRQVLDLVIQIGALRYGREGKRQDLTAGGLPARLYTPDGVGEDAPLLVFFHGGGWVVGSVASHDRTCGFIAGHAGCKVLSVDYRLAPKHQFPAAADDAVAAFRWAREHAYALGIDPTRMAVGGDSAGGNLSVGVCLSTVSDPVRPRTAWLLYPAVSADLDTWPSARLFAQGPLLSRPCTQDMLHSYAPGPRAQLDPRVSVITAENLHELPPTYVAVAGMDLLRDQGVGFAERARTAGVAVELDRFDCLPHGFANLLIDRRARAATVQACFALRRLLSSDGGER